MKEKRKKKIRIKTDNQGLLIRKQNESERRDPKMSLKKIQTENQNETKEMNRKHKD